MDIKEAGNAYKVPRDKLVASQEADKGRMKKGGAPAPTNENWNTGSYNGHGQKEAQGEPKVKE